MNTHLVDKIRETLSTKSTADLLTIWETNNQEVYSAEAFEIIGQLLMARSVDLPRQQIYKKVKKYEQFDNNSPTLFSLKATHYGFFRKSHNWEIKVKPTALLFMNHDDDEYNIIKKENFKNVVIKKSGFIHDYSAGSHHVFRISKSDVSKLKHFLHPLRTAKRVKRRLKAAAVRLPFALIFVGIGGLLVWLGADKANNSLLHIIIFYVGILMLCAGAFGILSGLNIILGGRELSMPNERVHWFCPSCGHSLDTWEDVPDPGQTATCPNCSRPVTKNSW